MNGWVVPKDARLYFLINRETNVIVNAKMMTARMANGANALFTGDDPHRWHGGYDPNAVRVQLDNLVVN